MKDDQAEGTGGRVGVEAATPPLQAIVVSGRIGSTRCQLSSWDGGLRAHNRRTRTTKYSPAAPKTAQLR